MTTLPSYVPVIILVAVAVGFAVFTLVFSQLLGRMRPTPTKLSTYECGMPPVGTARQRFSIKFYLVAMIFILFDVDVAFVYPWAQVLRDAGSYGLWTMGLFIAVLAVADIYAWKVGALDW